jgi:methyl-accepting chemotaxis protein
LRDIAQGQGDLTKRVDVVTQDEIGELGGYFNIFISKLQNIISEV